MNICMEVKMALWGKSGDMEIDCTPDKKDGQLLCKAKKGKHEAIILGQVGKDGVFRPMRRKGNLELLKELEQYMVSNVDVSNKFDT